MLNADIRAQADYQQFAIHQGHIQRVGTRMEKKREALASVWPDMRGKTVLDIGCDFGFWSFLAAEQGARRVLGVDRSRNVRGVGWVDIPRLNEEDNPFPYVCEFRRMEVGVEFHKLGFFDVIFCMSLYHHIYQNTGGDHESVWYWLWRQASGEGRVIWENPVSVDDPVVQANVHPVFQENYTEKAIRAAAEKYFEIEKEGPALHEPTRVVWSCRPKKTYIDVPPGRWVGELRTGAGGASKAFEYANGRRMVEIEKTLGVSVYPGSLNIELDGAFGWDTQYYRTLILDVVDRSKGLGSAWKPRACRFYPLWVEGVRGWAMRFEGESYPDNFIEVLGRQKFRDRFSASRVKVEQ